MVMSVLTGKLVRKFGRKTLLTGGSMIICLSYFALGLSIHLDWSIGVLLFLLTFNIGF
jgi:Na+/melibiose symporter-like transporter